jgi:hypothetical protein
VHGLATAVAAAAAVTAAAAVLAGRAGGWGSCKRSLQVDWGAAVCSMRLPWGLQVTEIQVQDNCQHGLPLGALHWN